MVSLEGSELDNGWCCEYVYGSHEAIIKVSAGLGSFLDTLRENCFLAHLGCWQN